MNTGSEKYLALSGGIGGAKLALGLQHCLGNSQLTIVANTGDDFEHLGLSISPDIDTLLYTLADLNNQELGWGRRDESWNFAEASKQIGLDSWFSLGDRDLAIHLYRSQKLRDGLSLSQIVEELCKQFQIKASIVPMSDSAVRTMLDTDIGILPFQEYFVKNRCKPVVSDIYFDGIEKARPAQAFLKCLDDPDLKAIIICPSNPFLSINPILLLPSLKEKICAVGKPVIVVSPIVKESSIKGPTAKLMQELNLECSVKTIASLYKDIASAIVIDNADKSAIDEIKCTGLEILSANIVMNSLQDKISLANQVIDFSRSL